MAPTHLHAFSMKLLTFSYMQSMFKNMQAVHDMAITAFK